jgi:hypothetical protein
MRNRAGLFYFSPKLESELYSILPENLQGGVQDKLDQLHTES